MKGQNNSKVVLFFLQSGVGGAERMSLLIARFLNKAGFIPHLVVLATNGKGSDIGVFIPQGFKVTRLEKKSRIGTLLDLYSVIRRIHPSCCFSSVININSKVLLLRRFFPHVKFVIRCDNYVFSYSRLQKTIIRHTYKLSDTIIAQTKEMGEELIDDIGISKNKVIVLQNPIDKSTIDLKLKSASSPFQSDGRLHVVSVGRFAYQKGYDILIRAISILIKRGVPADLFIVGSNSGENESEYNRVMRIVQEEQIGSRIHCVGFQDNPYTYMRYADCFVLSSRWEGLPNVLVEALYLGTPVAAVECIPIISRIVKDGFNGFLAESESAESLANAIQKSSLLGKVSLCYSPSEEEDFVELFERITNEQ